MATRMITTRRCFSSFLFQSYTCLSIKSSYASRLRLGRVLTATSALRFYNSQPTKNSSLDNFRPENNPPKETTLFDERDNEHWLITMDIDRTNFPLRMHVIDRYIETLATIVGSKEEARKKIYSVHARGFYAFGARISKQLAHKMRCLEKVIQVIPVSHQDVKNNVHAGEPFVPDHDGLYMTRSRKNSNYGDLILRLRCEQEMEIKRINDRFYDYLDYDIYSRSLKTRIYNMQLAQLGQMSKYVRGWPIGSNYSEDWDAESYFYGWENEGIQKGDIVNLSSLLFTKRRDYLIRYNDSELVTAEHLAGKIIVLYFVPLHLDPDCCERELTASLMETYKDLESKNCFEVVLIVVDDVPSFDGELGTICPDPSFQSKFEYILSQCPSFPAIPFWEIRIRQLLKRRFGHFHSLFHPEEVLIDSTGMVLETFPQKLFHTYGSEAYPFSDEMIRCLNAKDETTFTQTSLKELLGSSERDFVISNKGEEVPIDTLEDKVVALFFYEDGLTPHCYTNKIKKYYEELAKKNSNFEVVLLYLHDTNQIHPLFTNEEAFWNTFKTMPWLALPYKDLAHKKLKRIFGYPDYKGYGYGYKPTFVIVGPHRGIIEPDASTILSRYDANQLRCEEFAKAGPESWELKLEMLCSPNTVFRKGNGSEVLFSQLAGKRIMLLFEGEYPEYDGFHFREKLRERYMHMKGTADEFEVIYFPNGKDEKGELVADVPWLVSRIDDMSDGGSAFLSYYCNPYNRYQSSFVLAFGRNGSLVRRMICPKFGDTEFPFCDYGVAPGDGFDILSSNFCWGYWDTLYQGLLRDSNRQVNFPSGDLLFCMYYY